MLKSGIQKEFNSNQRKKCYQWAVRVKGTGGTGLWCQNNQCWWITMRTFSIKNDIPLLYSRVGKKTTRAATWLPHRVSGQSAWWLQMTKSNFPQGGYIRVNIHTITPRVYQWKYLWKRHYAKRKCMCMCGWCICGQSMWGSLGLGCSMTPGLSKDIRCHVWPYFLNLQITRSDIQTTHKVGCQPSACIWSLYLPQGFVGMYGLTYSLYHPEGLWVSQCPGTCTKYSVHLEAVHLIQFTEAYHNLNFKKKKIWIYQ